MPLLRIQIDLDSYEVKQQETRSRKQKTGSRRQRQKTGSRRQKIKTGSKDKRQDLEGGEWGSGEGSGERVFWGRSWERGGRLCFAFERGETKVTLLQLIYFYLD